MSILWYIAGFITCAIICFVVSYFKKPKTYGTIMMFNSESLYLELDNDESLSEIYSNDYATFRVQHKNAQK